jgi:hypothetical protein
VDKTLGDPTAAAFTGLLKADAAGVLPGGVALTGAGTGNFVSTATLGTTPVTYTGFTLAGANVANFALPISCCTPVVQRTSGNIIAALSPPPPAVPPAGTTTPGTTPGATPPPAAGTPSVAVVVPSVALVSEGALVPVSPERQMGPTETEVFHPELNLGVLGTGVRMPPVVVAQRPLIPPPPIVVPPPVIVPPPVYVPPVLPPRPARN